MIEGIIYKYTSPSGKVYIGQTRCEANRRKQFNCLSHSYGGKPINNARMKYSPSAFKYEVLQVILARTLEQLQDELNISETRYITCYKSDNPKFGYNSTSGGQNAPVYGMAGKNHTEETKEKLSNYFKNNQKTLDQLKQNGMKTAIKVDVFTKDGDLLGTYESITEAANAYNANKANVARNIKGDAKYKTVKGYVFKKHINND